MPHAHTLMLPVHTRSTSSNGAGRVNPIIRLVELISIHPYVTIDTLLTTITYLSASKQILHLGKKGPSLKPTHSDVSDGQDASSFTVVLDFHLSTAPVYSPSTAEHNHGLSSTRFRDASKNIVSTTTYQDVTNP